MVKKIKEFKFNVSDRVRFQSGITNTGKTGVIIDQHKNGGERFSYNIITDDGEFDMAFEDMCCTIGEEQDSLEKGNMIKKAVFKDLGNIIESHKTTFTDICQSLKIPVYKVNDLPEHCTLEINDFFQILAVLGYSIKLEPNKTVSSITNNITKPSYKIGDIVEYNDCDELKSGKVIDIISDSIIGNIGIIKGKDGYNFYDVGAKAKVK